MVQIETVTQYLVGGHYFNDYQEALEFKEELEEKERTEVKMYGPVGQPVEKASQACYVSLKGKYAAKTFCEQCEVDGTKSDGIDEECEDEGFFVWSLDEGKYIYLSPDDIRAIKTIFKDEG